MPPSVEPASVGEYIYIYIYMHVCVYDSTRLDVCCLVVGTNSRWRISHSLCALIYVEFTEK